MELMAPILGLGLLALLFWVPLEILHKAGFSRWWGLLLLVPPCAAVGLILFALTEWPIHRELAWRRLASGSFSEADRILAQNYAIDLEARGAWQEAIEVHETLARNAPDKRDAEYAVNCIRRLQDLLEQSRIAF